MGLCLFIPNFCTKISFNDDFLIALISNNFRTKIFLWDEVDSQTFSSFASVTTVGGLPDLNLSLKSKFLEPSLKRFVRWTIGNIQLEEIVRAIGILFCYPKTIGDNP